MAKFKVGDKVRVVKPINHHWNKFRGDVLTISDVENIGSVGGSKWLYSVRENEYNWHERELELVKEKENMFTKKDLKEFDIVKLRNGEVLMVLRNDMSRDGLAIFNKKHHGCHQYIHSYNYELTYMGHSDNDIVAVKKFDGDHMYIHMADFFADDRTDYRWDWERKDEPEEMTLEEVCKALGKEIKIVKE